MSQAEKVRTIYLQRGDPDNVNVSTLYRPGELGARFSSVDGRKMYQMVNLDTGATSSTNSGVVATNDLAFWKDKTNYLVTNDIDQAEGTGVALLHVRRAGTSQVAGVFRVAATAGNYTAICQRGENINVPDGGNTFLAGQAVFAENDTASAADQVAVGTAATDKLIGYARGGASGGFVAIDLHIPEVE